MMRAALLLILALNAPARLVAALPQGTARTQAAPEVERDEQRRVRVKVPHGMKVAVDNVTTGRIVVEGWDRDYVEAVATSERGTEHVRARTVSDPDGQYFALTADYLTPPWPSLPSLWRVLSGRPAPTSSPAPKPTPTPAPEPAPQPKYFPAPEEIHLHVRLPRQAVLYLIEVNRSEVEVTGVATPVTVNGRRSAIKLRDVGAVEVRNESGPVEVEGAAGLVDVVTSGGHIRVRDVRGDVRALSLSGRIELRCVRGRVNAGSTEGAIVLSGVEGDADAMTVNSDVKFDGPLRAGGRYHLKSMSGSVEMGLRRNPPGFTALLSSYRGPVETDFQLGPRQQPKGANGTRLTGRHGDGRAQITLDSFDGLVKLSRLAQDSTEGCK
jgi:hypothetical protein